MHGVGLAGGLWGMVPMPGVREGFGSKMASWVMHGYMAMPAKCSPTPLLHWVMHILAVPIHTP